MDERAESAVLGSASVRRVAEALDEAGVATEIVELPGAARTAKAAAEFLGCDAAQIANSLVFRGGTTGTAILVMSSGARRVDLDKLAVVAGEPIEKAGADFVKLHTGFAIGGVAPVGHVGTLRRFVERSLGAYPAIWAASGHPNTVMRLTYAQLLHLTGGVEIDVATA
jgi:prolyl-tRNA editing enzyme YbaK/EbsC (Cys-tRNA(Pro) deacylase)